MINDLDDLKLQLADITFSQNTVEKNIQAWLKRSRELAHKYREIEDKIKELEK